MTVCKSRRRSRMLARYYGASNAHGTIKTNG